MVDLIDRDELYKHIMNMCLPHGDKAFSLAFRSIEQAILSAPSLSPQHHLPDTPTIAVPQMASLDSTGKYTKLGGMPSIQPSSTNPEPDKLDELRALLNQPIPYVKGDLDNYAMSIYPWLTRVLEMLTTQAEELAQRVRKLEGV